MPVTSQSNGNTLGKSERLTRTKLIDEVYSKGETIKSPAILLVYRFIKLPVNVPAQVMITAGKKNFPDAHDRNRIRRLMKEVYRRNKHAHYAALHNTGKQAAIMLIFTGRKLPEFDYIEDKITDLLNRFTQVVLKDNQSKE